MNVLIVDDEPKVCQLIRSLIDWEALGFHLVGEVHDSQSALRLLEHEIVNIVITDIRMPGVDGIELISLIKEKYPQMQFVVISGHSDFSYAQSALRLRVEDYLLKPINQQELERSLLRMKEKHQAFLHTEGDLRLRHAFFQTTLFPSGGQPLTYSLEEINREFGYQFEEGLFFGLVAQLHHSLALSPEERNNALVYLEEALRERFAPVCQELEFFASALSLFAIFNCNATEKSYILMQLETLGKEVAQQQLLVGVPYTLGVGPLEHPFEQLGPSLFQGEQALSQRFGNGSQRLYLFERTSSAVPLDTLLADWTSRVEQVLSTLNHNHSQELLQDFQSKVESYQPKGWERFSFVSRAGERLLSQIRHKNLLSKEQILSPQAYDERLGDMANTEELWEGLRQLMGESIAAILEHSQQDTTPAIRMAKHYINTHFAENITLEEVSESVGFNANYFSTLFKKETGQGFVEYLSRRRIEEAKVLLTTTNQTIASIAPAVGYSDIRHFTRLFRKYALLKPNEYRKLHT